MKPLCDYFRLFMFDIIGMGASSRPADFNINSLSASGALDYFIDHVEQWRSALGLDRFYLGGHSFGGFICGNYAIKYP